MRFWVSWWSGYYADEGCTQPPFQVWISGERGRGGDSNRNDVSICAVLDADNEDEAWNAIHKHFPDYEERFCKRKHDTFIPSERFPDFENKTTLT